MSGIYWLASYPKSGNTWLRVFLTNYDRNSSEPARINELPSANIGYRRQLFDDWLGLETAGLSDEDIDRYRPRVYEKVSDTERFRFVKTHERFRLNCDGEPVFSKQATKGVIFLIRNPIDVAISMSHFWQIPIESALDRMADDSFEMASNAGSFHDHFSQKVGSWSRHAKSWLESGFRLHVVRYEDILENPHKHFAEILEFVGLTVESARLERSVKFSQISELQAQEAKEGFHEHHTEAATFFRRGDFSRAETQLNFEQVEKIRAEHGELMERFGYDKS